MADYWGARAYRPSGGPNGEGTRYAMPEPSNVEFTMPSGENNSTTIETVRQRIMGQHPEDISALADQWQNAYNLLSSIRLQVLETSNRLYNEHWRSAEARDAFMRKGPGEALAYLDDWMDAASNNIDALRALVGIATTARSDMEDLWSDYEREIADASVADGGTAFMHGFATGFTLGLYDGEAGIQGSEAEAVREKHEEFNRRAQDLANRVADEYFETFSKVSAGHGAPFLPMDAVFNPVNGPPWLTSVSPPAVTPPPTPPPIVPTVVPPPPPPVVVPTPPPLPEQTLTEAPTAPTAPQFVPPALPGVGATKVPEPAPGAPGGVPGVAPVPPGLVAPAARGGPSGPSGLAGPSSSGLQKGVLQGRSAPAIPPGTLPPGMARPGGRTLGRRPRDTAQPPGTAPPPGRTLGRRQPGAPGSSDPEQRSSTAKPTGTGDEFTRPPANTAPPVLNNQRPGQRKPGSREELSPTGRGGGTAGTPAPVRPGTTPPVLNQPPRAPAQTGPTGKRPGRDATARPPAGGSGQAPPGTEWVGVDAAREDATTPVLDAPPPPVSGAAVSRLEEVPTALRSRHTPAGRATGTGAARDAVPGELAARQTVAATGAAPTAETEEEPAIVTDEEAFNVETPGGGVLTKQREDTSYRPEPPTALRGN